MPELDGLETLVELRKLHPRLPVIMFSTLTERGGAATLEALARGAIRLRHQAGQCRQRHPGAGPGAVRTHSPHQGAGRSRPHRPPGRAAGASGAPGAPAAPRKDRPLLPVRLDVLAIGVSTGGPNALAAILPLLPADFPLPIVIVQHMPPVFTRLLADRLSASSKLQVCEATEGGRLEPGVVWIAPGNQHMLVQRTDDHVRVVLNSDPPENSCRPAVDPLFRSVAATYHNRTLALVLTGMGNDGLRGADQIVAEGRSPAGAG